MIWSISTGFASSNARRFEPWRGRLFDAASRPQNRGIRSQSQEICDYPCDLSAVCRRQHRGGLSDRRTILAQ